MRLAQLSRKVNVKPAEIRSFIKSKFNVELEKDPNIKVDDEHVDAVMEEFKVEEPEEVKETPVVEEVVEEIEVDPNIETDVEALKELAEQVESEPVLVKADDVSVKSKEDEEGEIFPKDEDINTNTRDLNEVTVDKNVVEIKYDEEVETEGKVENEEEPTSFDEVEVDREAELIAARVEKLEGLKVVGKIDLGTDEPEPELEELPSADAIETEIDSLDGEVDTSEFPEMKAGEELSGEKAAIFAELDAAMDSSSDNKVKQVTNEASEVQENVEEEEYSIYKDKRGIYRWTSDQKKNRKDSLATRREKVRLEKIKLKKQRHYEENVAAKIQPPKKKKTSKPSKKQKQAALKEEPKGLWQRFVKWLND